MEALVEEIERSFAELERRLNDPSLYDDPRAAADVARRHGQLAAAHALCVRWRELRAEHAEAIAMLDDAEPAIREMARQQRSAADEALPRLEEELRFASLEPEPDDARDAIVELRPGAGGDEAALWSGDLFEMYSRFAQRNGLAVEIISSQPADVGGFKDVSFSVKGDGAYGVMRHEGGVHRVQRVPQTESQGRIHTSTASVVVLAEQDEVELAIDPEDIRVDVYRSSGPGGQSVNTTDSAVRLTHVPSGIVVTCQNEKSQHQNRDQAMRVLRARLHEAEEQRRASELGAQRRVAIGTGDRSEKIRTYNYPDGRVTDHRIRLTVHRLEQVLAGELDPIVDALRQEEQRRRLEERFGNGTA